MTESDQAMLLKLDQALIAGRLISVLSIRDVERLIQLVREYDKDNRRMDWLSQKHITGTIAIDAVQPINRRALVWVANQSVRKAIDAAIAEEQSHAK